MTLNVIKQDLANTLHVITITNFENPFFVYKIQSKSTFALRVKM